MKKLVCVLLTAIALAGCGDPKTICGREYPTYGLFDKEERRDPNVKYELVMGNVIWSVLTIQTVALPVYFIGFSMWEPVGPSETSPCKA